MSAFCNFLGVILRFCLATTAQLYCLLLTYTAARRGRLWPLAASLLCRRVLIRCISLPKRQSLPAQKQKKKPIKCGIQLRGARFLAAGYPPWFCIFVFTHTREMTSTKPRIFFCLEARQKITWEIVLYTFFDLPCTS